MLSLLFLFFRRISLVAYLSLFTIPSLGNADSKPAPPIFSQPPPFQFLLPQHLPRQSEIINTLEIAVSPNEIESVALNLYSTRELQDLKITTQDFVQGAQKIPASQIDVQIVHPWEQAGSDIFVGTKVMVPELLVYNDNEYKIINGKKIFQPTATKQNFLTTLPAGTSKQFWITLHTPKNAAPGVYTSLLRLKTPAETFSLPIKLTVWPITLIDSKKRNFAFYNLRTLIDGNFEDFAIHIKDIAQHGFNGILLTFGPFVSGGSLEAREGKIRSAFQMIKEAGLTKIIVQAVDPATDPQGVMTLKQIAAEFNLEIFFYGLDEPNPDSKMDDHLALSDSLRKKGAKITTALLWESQNRLENPKDGYYDLVDPRTQVAGSLSKTFREQNITNEALDLPIYHSHYITYPDGDPKKAVDIPLLNYIKGIFEGTIKKKNKIETYYWQATAENPLKNRLLAGHFVMTSELDGLLPLQYSQITRPASTGNPYDDFDNNSRGYRDLLLTYPAIIPHTSNVPTLQWDALRAGFNEQRYVTTLKEKINEYSRSRPAEANAILKKLREQTAKYLNAQGVNDPFAIEQGGGKIVAKDFKETRDFLAREIIKVQNLLALIATPTPTATFTNTPTNTPTITETPTFTPTLTSTPKAIAPVNTPTPTSTPTQNIPTSKVTPSVITNDCSRTAGDLDGDGSTDLLFRKDARTLSINFSEALAPESAKTSVFPYGGEQFGIGLRKTNMECRNQIFTVQRSKSLKWRVLDPFTGTLTKIGTAGNKSDTPIFGCASFDGRAFIDRRNVTSIRFSFTDGSPVIKSFKLPSTAQQLACGIDELGEGQVFTLNRTLKGVKVFSKPLNALRPVQSAPLPISSLNHKLIALPINKGEQQTPAVLYTDSGFSYIAVLKGKQWKKITLSETLLKTTRASAGITADGKVWIILGNGNRNTLLWVKSRKVERGGGLTGKAAQVSVVNNTVILKTNTIGSLPAPAKVSIEY